jgi:hypothetical protein
MNLAEALAAQPDEPENSLILVDVVHAGRSGQVLLTAAELDAYEKRLAAVHEAGHVVVAAALGDVADAKIYRTEEPDSAAWHGLTTHRCLENAARPRLGLAGIVAECVHDSPDVTAAEVVQLWRDGYLEPSQTDLRYVPEDWDERLTIIEKVLAILNKGRRLLEGVASDLLENERLTRSIRELVGRPR